MIGYANELWGYNGNVSTGKINRALTCDIAQHVPFLAENEISTGFVACPILMHIPVGLSQKRQIELPFQWDKL